MAPRRSEGEYVDISDNCSNEVEKDVHDKENTVNLTESYNTTHLQ